MTWLQLRLGLRDAWNFYRNKAMTGSFVALLAVAVTLAATGTSNFSTVVAWAGLVVGITAFFFFGALRGRNAVWERKPQVQSEPGGRQLYLSLVFRACPRCGYPRYSETSSAKCGILAAAGTGQPMYTAVAISSTACIPTTSMRCLLWHRGSIRSLGGSGSRLGLADGI